MDLRRLAPAEPAREPKGLTWWSGNDLMCWDPADLRVERWKQAVDDASYRCVETWSVANVFV